MSNAAPEFVLLPINEIEILNDNPREINDKEFKALCKDIANDPNFLMQRPPLVNYCVGRNICYAGNQRVKAARAIGMTSMHVWREHDVPKELQDERMMKDNLHRGEWNMDMLKNFNMDFLLDVGFKAEDLNPFFNDVIVPEEEDFDLEAELEAITEPVTKPGDLYQLGSHRLICGDATCQDTITKLLNGATIQLCTTDPPYNVNYQGGTKKKLKIENDNLSNDVFYSLLHKSLSNVFQVMEPGGMLYVFHSDTEGVNFRHAFVESGFKLSQCCVWVKNALVMGRQDYHWQHEPVLVGWKEGSKHRWFGGRDKSTVWNFNKPLKNEEHPTMKPIELINYTITNSSQVGDNVIDLFGGSGTTLMSCELLKRNAFLSELDPVYCDIIVKRWELMTGEKAIKIS